MILASYLKGSLLIDYQYNSCKLLNKIGIKEP